MDKTVAAIELTSNQIKLVVGYELDGQIYVLYTLSKPIKDLIQNGKVVDQIALAKEISNIVDIYDGQAKLKIKIQEILLILPSSGLEIYQSNDTTTVLSEEHKVSHTDIVNLYTIIRNGKLPGNNILIDIVPNSFILDNNRMFVNPPLNEASRSVSINARVHTLPPSVVEGYFNTIRLANLKINHSIVAPFAASELLNSYQDTPSEYFLVDFGGDMTSVSLIGHKQLFSGRTFNYGSNNITRRIASEFNISEDDAEHLKVLYGIDNRELNFKAPICSSEDAEGNLTKHYTEELTALIKSELDDFIKSLKASIEELLVGSDSKYKKLPLIVIGGGSLLNGLINYISPKIDNDVIYNAIPKTLGARNPGYFNCLGAILVHSKFPLTIDNDEPKIGSVSRNIK